jgi:hypothetical protein
MPARMRPRFEFVAPCPPAEAAGRLRAALDRPEAWCRGTVYRGHAVLHVPNTEERVWSPFLSLDLSSRGERTCVRGLYGPKPATWSLFVAAYAVCACLALFALVVGWAQWSLDQEPWAFAVLPAAALGALATYGLARYGQHRGRGQMEALRGFLEDAIDTPVPPPR